MTYNIPLVDLKAQYLSIKEEIDTAILDCVANANFIGGNEVKLFEDNFAEFCESDFCVAVANGTDALEISLKCLNIGPGDEVIIPSMTFISTGEAVVNVGAKPVFCDIDNVFYTIDTDKIERLITPKTKAIIPVHLYGQMAEMDRIRDIATKNSLYIIEDAAQAHGAYFKDKPVGFYGDLATFSFYPGKNLGAYGDGGAIITNNSEWAKKVKMISNHGRTKKYEHEFVGRNSRLDTIQAAILNVKLKHLQKWVDKRNQIALRYNDLLSDLPIILPKIRKDSLSAFHLYVIRIQNGLRDPLLEYLGNNGIGAGIHYPYALHNLGAFKDCTNSKIPAATEVQHEIVSLPLYPELSTRNIEHISEIIFSFIQKQHKIDDM